MFFNKSQFENTSIQDKMPGLANTGLLSKLHIKIGHEGPDLNMHGSSRRNPIQHTCIHGDVILQKVYSIFVSFERPKIMIKIGINGVCKGFVSLG